MEDQPKIVMLAQDVINQIAAGEVIHQPINVVKELFENALDAEATQVEINLENGGFSLIQIIDNGCGISKNDLPNVCLRHSTSKIHQFIDLTTNLSTFGFRGEALFSMSCVSHLSITTKTENSDIALIANYENGVMVGDPEPIASVKGTVVEVRDIFYNKPEKLRAIPDSSSQNRQVLQMATQYSIAYPHVSVVVTIDKKEKLHTFGNTSTESVLALIYGLAEDTAFFKVEADLGFKVSAQLFLGTIASTRMMKGSAIFVNNRLVRCEKVKRAMEMVYSEFLKKGDKPFFVVLLSIPPKYVDVNVHPTKRDVNFENSQIIIERLCNVVHDHLAERIGGKTFKQKENAEQLTIENSIMSRSPLNKVSRKKKDGIEMQIHGSVQSSIITAPSFSTDSTSPSSQVNQNEDIDNSEYESQSQRTRSKSRRSIFDELKYTGIGSSNNDSQNTNTTNNNNNENEDEVNNTSTIESDSNFKRPSEPIEKDMDDYFVDNQVKPSNDFTNQMPSFIQNDDDDIDEDNANDYHEEEQSDSVLEDDENDQEENTIEVPKKRRYGLNLQPLSQNPPKSSFEQPEIIQSSSQKNNTFKSNFFTSKQKKIRTGSISVFDDLKYEPSSASKLTRGDPRERTIEQMFSLSAALSSNNDMTGDNHDEEDDEDEALHSAYREIDLESIQELREQEKTEMNNDLSKLFSKSIHVGTLRLKYVFFSSDDTLYMCDIFVLTRLFFYQLFLRHFGNYGKIRFRPPIDLSVVISDISPESDRIIDEINQHADLLDDYFRIRIKGNLLFNMPSILPGYEPSFTALGLFFNRLATEIEWTCEYDCIFGILDELAMLYAIQNEDETDDDNLIVMKKMIANVIMPEIKTEAFMPNASLITERALVRLKSASEMYKIFERT